MYKYSDEFWNNPSMLLIMLVFLRVSWSFSLTVFKNDEVAYMCEKKIQKIIL